MIETNIRIVSGGAKLSVQTRCAQLVAHQTTPELLQRACNAFHRRGLAAIPSGKLSEILVLADEPVAALTLEEENWCGALRDSGHMRQLEFTNPIDALLLSQLFERCLLMEIKKRTNFWILDSLRIWYEREPFQAKKGFAAYRRYEVGSLPIEGVGVALIVDVSTAFYTLSTIADFFKNDRGKQFEILSQRQKGQKATLLYDLQKTKHKCYFESFVPGMTCATTGQLRIRDKDYTSLQQYYLRQHHLQIGANEPVARVSFPGIVRPQLVDARLLRLRVMNASLPEPLDQVDKISPADRRWLIEGFFEKLGEYPLGQGKPEIDPGFWRPPPKMTEQIPPPDLIFGQLRYYRAPKQHTVADYKEHFRQRRSFLREAGCFHVPPAGIRSIQLVVPEAVSDAMKTRLAEDIRDRLSKWMKKPIHVLEPLSYRSLSEDLACIAQKVESGIVVFVFRAEEPAAYFTVANELKGHRLKRITFRLLRERFAGLQRDEHLKYGGNGKTPTGVRSWNSFIDMCALDVLQQMDCVPWTFANSAGYDAGLAIDVGWDRRHYALSLLICRDDSPEPFFRLDTVVEHKADWKRETINEVHLRDKIVALFKAARRRGFHPLRSVLCLRDGRECGRELDAIYGAQGELIEQGLLEKHARFDVVDFHKRSVKGVRLWEVTDAGEVCNVLEGRVLYVSKKTAFVANTGEATLRQGTAEPVMLLSRDDSIDMRSVCRTVSASSHLNWPNPGVAQRLPLELKRTDEQLESKSAEEIRRTR
jgi:hypothetical protein